MQTLTIGATAQLWHDLIRDAEHRACTALDEAAESYLVFTLLRHSRDAWLTDRTMALEWLDGMAHIGALRGERLRDVGDRCLLIAGLFAGQTTRRRVSSGYYIDLGRSAYRELSDAERSALATLYGQLAGTFTCLVAVLRELRSGRDLQSLLEQSYRSPAARRRDATNHPESAASRWSNTAGAADMGARILH